MIIKVYCVKHKLVPPSMMEQSLLDYFGGVTVYENARGVWRDSGGIEHTDRVDVLETICSHPTTTLWDAIKIMDRLSRIWGNANSELSVMYTIDGTAYYWRATE